MSVTFFLLLLLLKMFPISLISGITGLFCLLKCEILPMIRFGFYLYKISILGLEKDSVLSTAILYKNEEKETRALKMASFLNMEVD